jgi:hypothetical protein
MSSAAHFGHGLTVGMDIDGRRVSLTSLIQWRRASLSKDAGSVVRAPLRSDGALTLRVFGGGGGGCRPHASYNPRRGQDAMSPTDRASIVQELLHLLDKNVYPTLQA